MEENKMGTVPVSRLVISMGLPLMLSLLISSLYNFVDSVFVARVSEDALTAISLAAPMQLIVSSLGLGNAVGLNAVISRARRKESEKGKRCGERGNFYRILFVDLKLYSMSCLRPHLF